MEPALSIKHLTKHYGKNIAVNDLSLEVKKGEFFAFLGPNGAGKTTTIQLMTGIGRMEKGTIKVFGIDVVKEYREARKQIGLSPQEFNVDIFAKVTYILDSVAGFYGIPSSERKKRIKDLLKQFDLTSHANKEFRMLSGGLKRRVLLARALIHDPELLILDEPTAGVDVNLRRELWQHLKDLNKAGKTIFLTTHYLEEVEALANHVAIMNKGKIVKIGPKKSFMSNGKKLEDTYLKLTN
jgi:ABC-2 type transport system ATP-binding protein